MRIAQDRARVLRPPPVVDVVRPCVRGDGLTTLSEADEVAGRDHAGGALAFVPASGAATRLFAAWQEALDRGDHDAPGLLEGPTMAVWEPGSTLQDALRATLARWSGAPKGLVPFHLPRRTAVDEHLAEVAALGLGSAHFTVAAAHRNAFEAAVQGRATLSVQDPATDTIAFTPHGEPLRVRGDLVFRPAGHGALLGNLARAATQARGGLVAVKNIDNIVAPEHRPGVLPWRWRLLGRAATLRDAQHRILRAADASAAQALLAEAFGQDCPREEALARLDRPLRVAGMVRDEGEPGGGPYWVRGADGRVLPQIVEGAQLDPGRAAHQAARRAATHFHPVDMVLSVQGPHGPYDLSRFVAPEGYMVVRKTHHGHPLVAVERPGLWNGGMAGWNTIFAELPAAVFQPVKHIADLLRPAHRPRGGPPPVE